MKSTSQIRRVLPYALFVGAVGLPLLLTKCAPTQEIAPPKQSAPKQSAPAQNADQSTYSQLWGKDGEKWTPKSRLSDWSFAGYHNGEAAFPNPPVKTNVRDFGAKGDGEADDTQAFVRAIAATENGALLIPAGRYKITDIVYIRKPNIVLRGEGAEKSVLFFPRSLESIKPKAEATTTGQPTSGYSWSGGFIWLEGKPTGTDLGLVQTRASRGDKVLEMAATPNVAVGQRVEITQDDSGDNSLLDYLYAGQSDSVKQIKSARIAFVSRVTRVDGTRLTLDRALLTDVDPKWKARARVYTPSVREVGIEKLAWEFPVTPYGGHFTEQGFNPLALSGVADCWVRDVRVVNADSGPFLSGYFNTVDGIVYESNRAPDKSGNTGHHGFTLGSDNLLRHFDFRTKFVHDISAERSAGSVATQGKGVDLCFDNHKRFPYANLYTDIDLGKGTRMFASGGGADLGRHSAAWTTWWNIRAAKPQTWPAKNYGPDLMNFVGVESKDARTLDAIGRWYEPIPPAQLQPQNLYEAQLAHRLQTVSKP